MGQAFDRAGNVIGETYGPTKQDVFERLNAAHKDAHEIRVRSLTDAPMPERPQPIPGEQRRDLGLQGYSAVELGLDTIDDAMAYQPWHEGQMIQGDAVRDALIFAAKTILRNVPRSPRRTLALQHLISARMDANCAISFGGRF